MVTVSSFSDQADGQPVTVESLPGPGLSKEESKACGEGLAPSSARSAPRGEAPSLSISHNCIKEDEEKLHVLTGSHKRVAESLCHEIKELAREFGLERLGFLTPTLGTGKNLDFRGFQKRFHSLRTNIIQGRFERSIWVVERGTEKGRLHPHGVVVLKQDIRTGFDFDAHAEVIRIQARFYREGKGNAYVKDLAWQEASRRRNASASDYLCREWAFWRKTAPSYGFGRTEVLPVRSTAEGIARYVGGYISEHVRNRIAGDKGKRLVRFVGYSTTVEENGEEVRASLRRSSSKFGWNTPNGWLWRTKLKLWAAKNGFQELPGAAGPERRRWDKMFGTRWAYSYQEEILAQPIEIAFACFPDLKTAHEEVERQLRKENAEYLAAKGATRFVEDSGRKFESMTPAQEKLFYLRQVALELEEELNRERDSYAARYPF
jgi:hypothetical protein